MLTKKEKVTLLKIARDTLKAYFLGEKFVLPEIKDSALKEKRGAFVTLKKNGKLRGCIGRIQPFNSLAQGVSDIVIKSATSDTRFSPVVYDELKDIIIEISALTPPSKIKNLDDIIIGRDGVIIKEGFSQGVFLPQVAEETGWSKEEFMENLCIYKAGLPKDAWKNPLTEIYTFQAEVFSEEDF